MRRRSGGVSGLLVPSPAVAYLGEATLSAVTLELGACVDCPSDGAIFLPLGCGAGGKRRGGFKLMTLAFATGRRLSQDRTVGSSTQTLIGC